MGITELALVVGIVSFLITMIFVGRWILRSRMRKQELLAEARSRAVASPPPRVETEAPQRRKTPAPVRTMSEAPRKRNWAAWAFAFVVVLDAGYGGYKASNWWKAKAAKAAVVKADPCSQCKPDEGAIIVDIVHDDGTITWGWTGACVGNDASCSQCRVKAGCTTDNDTALAVAKCTCEQ